MAIEYIVNEEKRTVEAIIKGTENDAIHIFHKMQKRFAPTYKMVTYFTKNSTEKWRMSTQYRGVAKCMETDVWDVEIGKKIARQRCINKYRVALHKRLDYIMYCYEDMNEDMFDFVMKAGRFDSNHDDILLKEMDSKGDFLI